jgi:FkbM family methyltransferase
VAYEVFLGGVYDVPLIEANMVLDLGGHVGFATLWFARRFPNAEIIVVEPDPERGNQIRKHVCANDLESRVTVIEAAATVRNGRAHLSGLGSAARLGDEGEDVSTVDVFDMLGGRRVDVLKMDIEGSEYAIMDDPRFATLSPRIIAMEWHRTPEYPNGDEQCRLRLKQLGYRICGEYQQLSYAGNLIAEKSE